MNLRVTLVQQSLRWQDPEANRGHFQSLLAGLAGRTDLVVLPEMFSTGFSMDAERLAEPMGGLTSGWMTDLARTLGAAVTGSLIIAEGGKHHNRLLWATPEEELRHYDKRHLFRMAHEQDHYTAGRAALCIDWRGFRICPLVCYDLRFPVFSRRRPGLDYDLLLYVANWPAARRRAWMSLLTARAIENQAFVVGVNRIGVDGNAIAYSGDSIAVDFSGEPLLELGAEAAVATVQLDRAALRAGRERFPVQSDADLFTLET